MTQFNLGIFFIVVSLMLTGAGCKQSLEQTQQSNGNNDRPRYTDNISAVTDPTDLIRSSNGKWTAYYIIKERLEPQTMIVKGPDNFELVVDVAYPHSFSPDNTLLVYSAVPSVGNAPGIFVLELKPPYKTRQITNVGVRYNTGPTPAEFVPEPENQNVSWSEHRIAYSVEGEGYFTVDLNTGEVERASK